MFTEPAEDTAVAQGLVLRNCKVRNEAKKPQKFRD